MQHSRKGDHKREIVRGDGSIWHPAGEWEEEERKG